MSINLFTQSGRSLVAAGYAVYSSSTELVISLGYETVGFTLDPSSYIRYSRPALSMTTSSSSQSKAASATDAFLMSRPNIRCPEYGPYYSLNEAREPDWPDGLQRWVRDAKRGETASGRLYSSRYVCSLCADVHRTLLRGGWAGNPRPHLRLLYEAAPLAFLLEAAGGRGSDGIHNLLDVVPTGLHDRVCVFLGGAGDIADLESYGNIQQGSQTYQT
jgi:fructose-1,6-bisphosphatase I